MDLLSMPIQPYSWGSRYTIADFQGRSTPSSAPEAELWMGAHPSAPSLIERDGSAIALDKLITRDPEREIGPENLKIFGARLSFLMKILAVERALSLQVHPNRLQAQQGYYTERHAGTEPGRETLNYVDDWPKPELVLTMTPFEVFAGFRSPADLRELLGRLSAEMLRPLASMLEYESAGDVLTEALRCVLCWPQEERAALVASVLRSCARLADHDARYGAACGAIVRLAEDYDNDIGIVASLLLSHRVLAPGAALFLPSGALHAYVRGSCVEVQANSDNVMRAGLTAKKIDIPELMKIVSPRAEPLLVPAVRIAEDVELYDAGIAEFRLYRIHLGPRKMELPGRGGRIALCIDGDATLDDGDHGELELSRGSSCFIPAAKGHVNAHGSAVLLVATSGVPSNDESG